MTKNVCVAVSGGVDSSVAALLLKNQGCNVTGTTLKLFDKDSLGVSSNQDDIKDAADVCKKLGIPHTVLDLSQEFSSYVIDSFVSTYLCGKTPNPCIECNRHIKFGALLDKTLQSGSDFIASGHYCSIEKNHDGRYLLKKALDESKDQTYVLYMLSQSQLSKILFPLGGMTKKQVRDIAEDAQLINAHKSDSQDICFIKNGSYREFLENRTQKSFECGDFLLTDGTKLGKHSGIVSYTIGQRKGLGIAYSEPLYVVDKNMCKNCVIVGKESELYSSRVEVKDVNFIPFDKLYSPINVHAKLRYHQKESECRVIPTSECSVVLEFSTPQRAVTSGQAAVFYDGEYVVGGGTIV